MAIITPSSAQGSALLSGGQSWLSKDNAGDSFDASNNLVVDPLRLSATEVQSYIDFFNAVSSKINLNRYLVIRHIDASSVNGWEFISDKAYTVKSIKEVHSTIASSGSPVTLAIRKITDTSAPNAAASSTVKELLSGTFDLKATINTVVSGGLTATSADLNLATNDKIAFNFTGSLTALIGGVVVIELGF